tara:strand:- start:352 stop:1233 length:882 start_codon:yes stop_codon:yes gene_type:complete
MSLRPSYLVSPKTTDVVGSLFGAAIHAPNGGLFGPGYAVSPPRTPPTGCARYAQLPPEFHLDADPLTAPTATQADSIFPSWLHRFEGAALATFAQTTPGVVTLRESPTLQCANVVSPTLIHADGVHWQRMSTETGAVGHLFALTRGNEVVCRIEVDMTADNDDRVSKIAVVQPSFSPLTVAANMVPASSLLVYDDIRAHIDSLKRLRTELETSEEVGYVPTSELVCTGALDALVLSTDHSVEGAVARRHWKQTKSLLSELSSATADCCDAYVASELRRVGHRVVEARSWRGVV